MVLSRPEQFASAAMFGSGAISGEEEAIRKWLAALPDDAKPRFFFNTGFEDASMLERAKVMIACWMKQASHTKRSFQRVSIRMPIGSAIFQLIWSGQLKIGNGR
jgi:hypothetical protein